MGTGNSLKVMMFLLVLALWACDGKVKEPSGEVPREAQGPGGAPVAVQEQKPDPSATPKVTPEKPVADNKATEAEISSKSQADDFAADEHDRSKADEAAPRPSPVAQAIEGADMDKMAEPEAAAAPMMEDDGEAKEEVGELSGMGMAMAEARTGGAGRGIGRAMMKEAKKAGDKGGEGDTPVKSWKRSEVLPNASKLSIGDKDDLPLKGMQITVRMDGFRARVLIDFFFYNDRDSQYEGTFKLRLPGDASPFFFAFGGEVASAPLPRDVPPMDSVEAMQGLDPSPEKIMAQRQGLWSDPKEARMVTKEKAAFAFTDTVRRNVDPALMEWSGAGVFSSRVFPILPRSYHRIVIGYDLDLTRLGKDLEYVLDLPSLDVPTRVDLAIKDFQGSSISVEPGVQPVQDKVGYQHFLFDKPTERSIVVRVKEPGVLALAGREEATAEFSAVRFVPDLPTEIMNTEVRQRSGVFLVDVSLSSNPDKFNIWLDLMQAILEKNESSMPTFGVLFFNVETFWWKDAWVPNNAESRKELKSFCKKLALEGASDFGGALSQAVEPNWVRERAGSFDLFLLSDGSATWGDSDPNRLNRILKQGPGVSLFAYQTGLAGTDKSFLGQLTRESGGALFSVVGEAEVAKAAVGHLYRPWEIRKVEAEGLTDVLLAGRPTTLFPGQEVTLVGRGSLKDGGTIRLELAQPGVDNPLTIAVDKVLESDLTPRIYGQVSVGQLEELGDATAESSEAYARHFRITGKTCSLLMLESEADYARYNIKPEEDAFVVKMKPAGEVISKVLAEIGDALSNPKKAFLAWVKKLEKMPGMTFELNGAFALALDQMGEESFNVPVPRLTCLNHTWEGIPGKLQELLISKNLDYDQMVAEAARRLTELSPADALKALSSLVENNPGDSVMARDVGFSAMEWGLGAHAYHLFRRVADSRPYEPQTYRALALNLAEMGQGDLALAFFEVGLAGQWDGRFGEFRRIMGLDYLKFLEQVKAGKVKTSVPEFAAARYETVKTEFGFGAADILISITWNTDGTDVDLHVLEPTGEECYYSNNRTKIGGELTQDVTQGYGPEMYVLKKAIPGEYTIRAKYFSSDRNRASTRTKVYATVYQNWGTPEETMIRKVVALEDNKEMHDLAKITVKAGK